MKNILARYTLIYITETVTSLKLTIGMTEFKQTNSMSVHCANVPV